LSTATKHINLSAPWIDERDEELVLEVLRSGWLSLGPTGPRFEALLAEAAGARHCAAVSSGTAGLHLCMRLVGVGAGDEVITSPYSFVASANCAIYEGATPVFADIDPHTFNLDPAAVEAAITPRTKAIVAVDIFGCPADFGALMAIAREHDLAVIEDAAQAPGGALDGRPAGTLGHIGVYSLNYHKTIQCGEGGLAVTDDDALAERLALVRNHAEVVVGDMGADAADLLGFNYRMGELEAALTEAQLGRLDELTEPRIAHAQRLTEGLDGLEGVTPPLVPDGARHVFYLYVVKLDEAVLGTSRAEFAAALAAEGVPVTEGYVEPIYRQPLYRERTAGPFGDPRNAGSAGYGDVRCPVVERMHDREVVFHPYVHAGMRDTDVDDIVAAFRKVHGRPGR
jgi:dTDP-4-amino-4,6-dideoxygalactose transaminase